MRRLSEHRQPDLRRTQSLFERFVRLALAAECGAFSRPFSGLLMSVAVVAMLTGCYADQEQATLENTQPTLTPFDLTRQAPATDQVPTETDEIPTETEGTTTQGSPVAASTTPEVATAVTVTHTASPVASHIGSPVVSPNASA